MTWREKNAMNKTTGSNMWPKIGGGSSASIEPTLPANRFMYSKIVNSKIVDAMNQSYYERS
jgi:hypothetical protein